MRFRQLMATGATVVASVVIGALTTVRLAPAAKISPTPEELVERFSVFADDAVAKRILARDVNGDTYVARQELPERMQGLIERGDQNADGFLTANEVRALVSQASSSRSRFTAEAVEPQSRKQRADMTDVVSDLRLPPPKHDMALEFLRKPIDAGSDLSLRMRQLLDDEEYENFEAAAARIRHVEH